MTAPVSTLPPPDADALAHSARVVERVRGLIAEAGGWISFADYMATVLYAPGLGYYSAGACKLGAAGDFVTAPELTPLFGRCLARVCRRGLAELGGGVILEAGGGTGALAASILEALADAPPDRYLLLEVSADLRQRQRETLAARVPALLDRVAWLDRLPDRPVRGVVLANEVLDALPVERFRRTPGGVSNLGVTVDDRGFHWAERPASRFLAEQVRSLEFHLGQPLPDGYVSELSLTGPPWLGSLAGCLEAGMVLLVDYGGARREVYHPERRTGTLVCHYRHRAHDDPFLWPGLQDLTAWVDFSAVARSATAAGLAVGAYGTQAHFLLATGVLEELAAAQGPGPAARVDTLAVTRAVQSLLMPGEMGERFKVMALCRGGGFAWAPALVSRDLQGTLEAPA